MRLTKRGEAVFALALIICGLFFTGLLGFILTHDVFWVGDGYCVGTPGSCLP